MDMSNGVEFAQLWASPVAGIELFEAQIFKHEFDKHFHDVYTIGLNQKGRGQCLYKQTIHYQCPGSFNCINPGEVHTGAVASDNGWAFRNLYISAAAMRRIMQQLGHDATPLPCFAHIEVNAPQLRSLFQKMFQALSNPASQLQQQTLLLKFFSHFFDGHTCSGSSNIHRSEPTAIKQVRTYLEQHYADDISIDTLAKLVNLNPYYLIRCFKREIGLPPHSYKKQCQLLQAKQALHTATPLATVATDCGFYDQSHLNRGFKRMFGVAPGHYQKVNFIQSSMRSCP